MRFLKCISTLRTILNLFKEKKTFYCTDPTFNLFSIDGSMHLVRGSIQRRKWKMLLTVALTAQCVERSSPPKVSEQWFPLSFCFLCHCLWPFSTLLEHHARNFFSWRESCFFEGCIQSLFCLSFYCSCDQGQRDYWAWSYDANRHQGERNG